MTFEIPLESVLLRVPLGNAHHIDIALHEVAVGREELRIAFDPMHGQHPRFAGAERLFQRRRRRKLAGEGVVPEIVEIVFGLGVQAERAGGGFAA